MRWIRSFPARIPEHRAYVVDDMERLIIADYDYTPLGEIDEDVCLIEWDMAISLEDKQRFELLARTWDTQICVAPYRLYTVAGGGPVWAHRKVTGTDSERWVESYESSCDYFGFGLIYFPRDVVRAFLQAPAPERGRPPHVPADSYSDRRFHDQTFSVWHYWRSNARHREVVPITWDVRPVHLHY